MNPELTSVEPMNVVGLEVRTTNQEEMNPATTRIPGAWGRFYQEELMEKIAGRKPACVPLGVYSKYQTDHTGPYSLLVGVEVSGTGFPAGMAAVAVAEGPYLVFPARGPVPQCLIQTWIAVWDYFAKGSKHERAYTTDFERHLDKDTVDIYIAIR